MLAMMKHFPVSSSLFLFVRSRRQLEYYLKLPDTQLAANQSGMGTAASASVKRPNVAEIHPLARVRFSEFKR